VSTPSLPSGATTIADSGFWIALLSANDAHHARAKRFHDGNRSTYVTTWPVLTEVTHILTTRVHPQAAIDLMELALTPGPIVVWTPPLPLAARIPALMQRYLKLPMDLADASLVILAEALGHGRILTTDVRDFAGYRFKSREPFTNLLLE
jgi:uncharacterized protein